MRGCGIRPHRTHRARRRRTVARQRAAVAERMPRRLALFDALVDATRELAATRDRASSGPAAEEPW